MCHPASPTKREAVFQVKTNSRGFPKRAIITFLKSEPGGTSIVLKATDPGRYGKCTQSWKFRGSPE